MKKEGTIGTAAFLTIAAVVGVTSLQFGSKPGTGGQADRGTSLRRSSQTNTKTNSSELGPGCQSIQGQLQDFLNAQRPIAPRDCYVER
jgi:hypothetical protein